MFKDKNKVWELLEYFDIRPVKVQLEDLQNRVKPVGIFANECEVVDMGAPFLFMFSPPYNRFIENLNRVMAFYPQANKDFNINNTPINLNIIYDRQVFLIFLINSLEVFLSSTFRNVSSILLITDHKSEKVIKFIKKYGSIEKYNKYFNENKDIPFLSEFLTKIIYFQQKDTCRECYRLINIDLPKLDSILWQKIFSKEPDSYMQVRHQIIHGSRPSVKDINQIYSIEFLENALFDIVRFTYLIEKQRFLKYKDKAELADFIQELRKNKGSLPPASIFK